MLLGWRVRWKNSFRDFSGVVVGQNQDVCDVFEFCEEELFTLPTRTVTQVTPALLQYAIHHRTKLLKECDNSSTILEIHDTVIKELSALAGDKVFAKALQEAIKVEVALKATAERDMIDDQSDAKATKSGFTENERKGCKKDAKEELQKPTNENLVESSSEDEDSSSNNSSDEEEEEGEEEEEDDSDEDEDEEEDSSDDSNSSGDSSSSEEDSSSSEDSDEESKVDIKVLVLPSNDIRGFSVHLTEAGLRTIQKALKKDYGKIASIFFRDSDGDAIVIKSIHDFKYASNSAKTQFHTDGSARKAVLKLKLFAETSAFQNSQRAERNPSDQGVSSSSHCSTVPFAPASQVNFAGQGKESVADAENSKKSRGVAFGESTPSAAPSLHNAPSQDGIRHDAALNYEVVWKKGELLGSGSFGKVYSGMNLGSGERLAVKEVVLRRGKKHRQQAQALQLEVKILSSLDHPNIIKYLGTEYTKQTLRIFLELANDGTIKDALNEFGAFPESLVRRYTSDIVEGLWFLHSKKFIHRDIKPTNLLVSGGRVKLGDFGCSTSIVEDESLLDGSHNTVAGTAVYMAPEVMQAGDDVDLTALASQQAHTAHTVHSVQAPAPGKGDLANVSTSAGAGAGAQGSVLVRRRKGYGKRADIWSVGITLVEMATGRAPYANASAAIYAVCMSKQYPSFPAQFSTVAHSFLQRCLVEDPKLRATSAELRLHPFLNAQSADEVRAQTAAMPRTAHTTSTVTVHLPEDFSFLQSPRGSGGDEVADSRESEGNLAGRHKLESKLTSSFTGTDWFRTATTTHTTYNGANKNAAGRVQTAPAGAQRRMNLDNTELSPSAARQKLWSRTQGMDPLGVESKAQTEFSDSDSDPSPSRDDPFRSAGSSMFYSAPVHRSEGYEDEYRGGDRAAYLTARSVSQDEDMFQRIEDLPRALDHNVKLDLAAMRKDTIQPNKGTRSEQKSHDFYSTKECDEDEDCKTGYSTYT